MSTKSGKQSKKWDSLETDSFLQDSPLTTINRYGTFLSCTHGESDLFLAKLKEVFISEFESNNLNDERGEILREVYKQICLNKISGNIKDESSGPSFSMTNQEVEWMLHQPERLWLDYLFYRYQFKIYPLIRKVTNFPIHLLIEPTSVCNLRCVMCFQVDESFTQKQHMGYMSWSLFKKIADQAKENNCQAVTLASRGEPTLHPKFGEMLNYLRSLDITDLKINTNATRLTEELTHQVLSAGVNEVVFSVDAGTKATYESIRVRGNFDEVVKNIDRFNALRATHYPNSPTITRISGVMVRDDQDLEQMSEFWSKRVDQVAIKRATPRWDSYNNPPLNVNEPCGQLWERMYVWYDGKVNPCDFDYKSNLVVGNANDTPLSEIWTGPAYTEMRRNHLAKLRKNYIPCDRCPLS